MIIDSIEHVMLPTEKQISNLDAAGVDQAVLFTTTPHPEKASSFSLADLENEMSSLYRQLESPTEATGRKEELKRNIAEMKRAMDAYPHRFPTGFGPVPLGLGYDETREWVETMVVGNGLRGMGEFTPGTDEQVTQLEVIASVSEACGNLPLWVHTFTPVTRTGLDLLHQITERHPSVPIIFGHGGGYYWMDTIAFVRDHANAWFDLSAVFSPLSARTAMAEAPDRCLFGTDAPYGEPHLSRELIEFTSPSDKVTEAVLGGNIGRLLDI